MTSSEPIVNSLLNRLTEARAKLRAIDAERDQLLREIASLDHVAQMYTGVTSTDPQSNANILTSMTLGEALAHIAEENNGILSVVEAKRILFQCGKLNNAKNAGTRIYTHLAHDSDFIKVSPGKYRLVVANGNQPAQSGEIPSLQLDNA